MHIKEILKNQSNELRTKLLIADFCEKSINTEYENGGKVNRGSNFYKNLID